MGLFFIATNISAQHAIGTLSPEPSSAFDITSTTGGFLLPRMSNAERKLISNAAEGLQVYVTDYNNGSLMIFDGSNWNVFSKTIVVDDTTAPVITSPETGINLQENIEAGQTIYTITASDANGVGSYAIAGTDAALLSVNAGSGVVILTADPDYETKNSYSFTVTATDAAGTSNATTVTFSITDVNEIVVEVGDSYEGGIVFYLAPSPTDLDGDGVNDIGLIYAYSNYTTTKPWNAGGWCGGCASISTSTAIGTGATNTTNIINEYSNSGTASAAGFARAYNGGGFNDWFLPSTLEQDALVSYFIEKYPASGGWSDWGGIRSNNYWSSSQHNGNKAKQRSFTTGTSPVNNNKGNAVRVIPIRAF